LEYLKTSAFGVGIERLTIQTDIEIEKAEFLGLRVGCISSTTLLRTEREWR